MWEQSDPRFSSKSFADLEIVKKKELGKGGYASVKLGRLRGDPQLYAVKIIDLSLLSAKEHDHMRKEIRTHSMMRHPNIIRFYHLLENDDKLYMLLEYAPNGDLYRYIVDKERFSEKDACKIIAQVALALQYIHNKGILHRDLKPENILLDENFVVKVSDFGWCGEYKRNQRRSNHSAPAHRVTFCGTYEYMAPEVIRGDHQDEKVDVWSLGILLYELLHGKTPFRSNAPLEIQKNIIEGRFNIDKRLSPAAIDLIRRILRANAIDRYSVKQVLAHPFILTHIPNIDEFQHDDHEDDVSVNPETDEHLPTGEITSVNITQEVPTKDSPVQRHRISEIPIVSPKAVPNADSAHSKLSAILKQQIVKAEKHISSNPLISDRQYKWAGGEKSVNVPQKGPTTGENSYLDTSTTPVETPIKNRSPEHPPTGLRARNSPEKQSTPASVDRKRPESEARKKLEALRNQILNNYPKKQASDGVTIALSQVQPQTTQSTVHGSVYQSVINSPENKNLPNPSESPISSSRLAEISLNNKRSEKTLVNPILGRFAKEPRQPINSQGSSQRQLEPKPEKPNKQSADFRAPLRIPTDQSQSGVEAAKQGTATPAKRKPLYPSEKSTPVGLAPGSCSSLTNAEKSSTPHLFGEKPKNYASTLLQNYNVVGQSLLLLDKANPTNPRNTGSQERFTESMKFSKNELTSSLTNKSLGVIEGLNSQLNRKFSNTVINKKGSQPAQKSTSSRRSPLEPESPRVMSQRQVKAIAAQRPALDKVNLYSKGRPAESESYSPQHTPPTFYDKLSFEGKKILSSTRPMHQRNGSDSESVNSTASNKGSSMNIYQHNPRKLLS